MKKFLSFFTLTAVLLLLSSLSFGQKEYKYESVDGDPLKARIYTLDNGMKVYLTVYKDEPRIQTAIAVHTGGKNDPDDNTGLSHYLEHLMFKGTEHFGTTDFAKENVYLLKIDSLFEVYRGIKDTIKRKAVYHIIDSVSGLASKIAIANEYDKMMAFIGAKGTNAFTSEEETVYVNDIPTNQAKNWLDIEFDRFSNPVFRLFHTELETVYEEKNMSLDRDEDKVWEALYSGLWKHHQYGTHTVIGTIDHLKNPSIRAIKKYFAARYVPSNIAICMSGDFDPDVMIALIDKTFGSMAAKSVVPYTAPKEDPITSPIVKEVVGPDAESVMVAFRFGGANTRDADLMSLTDMVLTNSTAGLIDLDLNQAQKVLAAGSFSSVMEDYSAHIFYGNPKEGQTLEQVKDLLLAEIEKVKKGEFADWLLPAIINDLKLQLIQSEESNSSRTFTMVDAFIKGIPWKDQVNHINNLAKFTKQDIIDFANKNYKENYVVVYKRTGIAKQVDKVNKPVITPVDVNRDAQSDFVKNIMASKPMQIEPAFLDYNKDVLKYATGKGIPMLYSLNTENGRFTLYYYFNMGKDNDRKLELAVNYLDFLGTSKLTAAQIKEEFYKAGCSFSVYCSNDQTWVSLSGLSENMEKGLQLFENLLADPKADKEALENLVGNILKQRDDNKLSKDEILWNAMYNYGVYGSKSPYTNILSEDELKSVKPDELIKLIKGLTSFSHQVLYYGPENKDKAIAIIDKYHTTPAKLSPVPAETKFTELENNENKVYVVDYEMKQVEIIMMSKSELFNKNNVAIRRVFNEYFGSGMSSIVFQELREARALAYTAFASYRSPSRADRSHYIFSFIGTQNDKLPEAMKGMTDLINNMPESQKSFDAAKEAVISQIRTDRITKSDIIFNYLTSQRMGIDHDMRKDVFTQVPNFTFGDLQTFQQKYMKDKKYTILVLGKKDQIDTKTLEKYGKITYLSLKDIFGY
ncbi:MAG: insulinase family protein [Bacteroidota bacterium]